MDEFIYTVHQMVGLSGDLILMNNFSDTEQVATSAEGHSTVQSPNSNQC